MEGELDLSYLDGEDIDDDVVGVNFNIIAMIRQQLQITTSLAALTMLCIVAHALSILRMYSTDSSSVSNYLPDRDRRREQLMSYLVHTNRCRDIIRMGPEAFLTLCEKLRSTGLVKDAIRSTVEQQVAQFLHIIGHNVKNRSVAFFFHRSGSTVSKHFHNVLDAILSMESEFLIQPSGNEVHPYVLNNNRFNSYFKDCLGAIDGTHVRVKVPRSNAQRFRGRKDWPTQNVFAACDFDMKFTYVLAGWEGTASDLRILKNALDRDDPLVIPQGKYYLGDAGFMLKSTVLTPYRGVRYHLKEYTRRGPQNARELFNHRHSSLRNVIERTFGVLKKRFPIIASGTKPHYGLDTMTDIILACCILHNFLRGVDNDDSLLEEVDNDLNDREDHNVSSSQVIEEDHRIGSSIRDSIADDMWYKMNRGKAAYVQSSAPTREFIKWTEDMDARLLQSMIEESRIGNRVDGSWTSQAYSNMVDHPHSCGYVAITKNNVKNRQKVLKDKWREVHDLFSGLSGFAWNPVSMTFHAEDKVWMDLIQSRPTAAK
ncbi:protein ALP1-like [Vigna angularis]|uniref:protein ALP1-like n=1 Tax=Phaseolus angularis TaxID=3914 RepID=UPI0022B597E9|nr:protein ALP1-like [Vigna angularis]